MVAFVGSIKGEGSNTEDINLGAILYRGRRGSLDAAEEVGGKSAFGLGGSGNEVDAAVLADICRVCSGNSRHEEEDAVTVGGGKLHHTVFWGDALQLHPSPYT